MTRMESEKETMVTMVALYCRGNHDDPSPCHRCTDLISYANGRLDACPFGESKGSCRRCSVHCYDDEHRVSMSEVMRYSGPRMIIHHPLMALRHIFDSRWE